MDPLLELRGVEQTFGRLVALHPIDLSLRAGQITALLGDNGAGKSTLIKVITGFHPPRRGQLLYEGAPVRFTSPQQARDRGIEAVYQDLALVPRCSIARNFFLGREPTRRPFGLLDLAAMNEGARRALGEIGIAIRDPQDPVETLSGGERQAVAIGRAVYSAPACSSSTSPPQPSPSARPARCWVTCARPGTGAWGCSSSPTTCTTSTRWPITWWCSATAA